MRQPNPPLGPDPDFPVLNFEHRVQFPDAKTVSGKRPALHGANLSPGVLLSAYEQGYFPWYSQGEPLWWWSPDPRFGMAPQNCHCSTSMAKILRKGCFEIRFDTAFTAVMENCASVYRHGQDGTWITEEMIAAYTALHEAGIAHSVETWQDGKLLGGLYGVQNGRIFSGESMFSLVPNASKAAFITLCKILVADGYVHLDSQVHTSHVESLGGTQLSRRKYLEILALAHESPLPIGTWQGRSPNPGSINLF